MQHKSSREYRESLTNQLNSFTDKQINYFIHHIQPKHNRNDEYQQALASWNKFIVNYKLQIKQADSILKCKPKPQPNSSGSDICQICYEQMSRKRNWCRICGNECCQKCISRARVIDDSNIPSIFCEKCDKAYMTAMIIKQEKAYFLMRESAFLTLADEQLMMQALLKIQRQKIQGSAEEDIEKNQMLKKMNKITEITADNNAIKSQTLQIKRKIDWGDEIKGQLKKKLKRMKKNSSHSFASSVHEQQDGWAPPKADADEYVSVQNLNESIINSILQTQTQPQTKQNLKCNCNIF